MVKRTELVRRINEIARASGETVEGGRHTKVRIGDRRSVVPRHREVAEGTARQILKQLEKTDEEGEPS